MMTDRDVFRDCVRAIDDAYRPALRLTNDDALRKRHAGITSEGKRRLVMHERVLREAMQQEPEIARMKVKALTDGLFAEIAAVDRLADAIGAGRLP